MVQADGREEMSDALEDKKDVSKPPAEVGGGLTITIRFPHSHTMEMEWRIQGPMNDDQLIKAAATLSGFSDMRVQAAIAKDLAAANEKALARARIVVPNGRPPVDMRGMRKG